MSGSLGPLPRVSPSRMAGDGPRKLLYGESDAPARGSPDFGIRALRWRWRRGFSFPMSHPLRSTFVFIALALSLIGGRVLAQELKAPPAPEGYILDQGHVLTPEITERLGTELKNLAITEDMHVYLVTVHSVGKDKLDAMGAKLVEAWCGGKIGAVLCFDDEMGWVTVGTSALADEHFSSVVLNMVLRDPLLANRKKGMSRDKLERATMTVVEGFLNLKRKEARSAHRQKLLALAMGGMVLIVVVLGAVSYFSKPKDDSAGDAAPSTTPGGTAG